MLAVNAWDEELSCLFDSKGEWHTVIRLILFTLANQWYWCLLRNIVKGMAETSRCFNSSFLSHAHCYLDLSCSQFPNDPPFCLSHKHTHTRHTHVDACTHTCTHTHTHTCRLILFYQSSFSELPLVTHSDATTFGGSCCQKPYLRLKRCMWAKKVMPI
jgi:hypothetical protein